MKKFIAIISKHSVLDGVIVTNMPESERNKDLSEDDYAEYNEDWGSCDLYLGMMDAESEEEVKKKMANDYNCYPNIIQVIEVK